VGARAVEVPDGRVLDVWVEGEPAGDVVVWHYGTPSSGLPYPPFVEEARRRGLRLVTYSRPGYGDSSRHEGRSVGDCAADVGRILDALGVERFFTGGGSGGGPHALACAALVPDRVLAAVSVAGVTPYGAPGIDFLAGMGRENVEEFGAALEGPEALRAWMDEHAAELGQAASPDDLIAAMGDLVSEVDRASLTGDFGAFLVEDWHIALRNGYWGWFDDDLAFTRDWGFDPTAIAVPVAVWQGRQDRFVPFAHGEWLAEHVPRARVHLFEEHGHLSLAIASFGEILDDLMDMAQA
jgi:pimeloyl-ACP methyl ester carboxylesterase